MTDEHVERDGDAPASIPELVLGPDEIINYPLRKATRGYAVKEVDDLLDQLAVQTQDLLARLGDLEQDRDRLREQLEEANETESMLKRTLVTAQRAAEASVAEAREEADALRDRARERAEQLLADAAEQAHELRERALRRARADEADIRRYRRDVEEHVESLRTFAADHRARLAHHLQLQQERLGEMDVPDAPPPPELAEDEIVALEVEDVDVREIVDDLARDTIDQTRGPVEGAAAAETSPAAEDAANDDTSVEDGASGDVVAEDVGTGVEGDDPADSPHDPGDEAMPDTSEKLFEA